CTIAMMAACARVGANAPNGGKAGSLAGAVPGSRGAVKNVLVEYRILIAEFCLPLQRRAIAIAPAAVAFVSLVMSEASAGSAGNRHCRSDQGSSTVRRCHSNPRR